MSNLHRHIIILLNTFILLFSACSREMDIPADGPETPEGDNKLQVELFTQVCDFSIPVTRDTANEDDIDPTPWVLVFKGSGHNATFVEIAKAYTVNGNSRTFVNLTPQGDPCLLLILANPQYNFYLSDGIGSYTSYDARDADIEEYIYKEGLNDAFAGKSLEYVCSNLFTESLANPQTLAPFIRESLPMSCLYTAAGGISAGIKLRNTDETPLKLDRAVANVIVKSTTSDFKLSGVAAVINAPNRGLLHNLSDTPPVGIETIDYRPTSGLLAEAADSSTGDNSTAGNSIYLYESHTANKTCIIVKGEYKDGVEYFYKMSVVDNEQAMNIFRNCQYTFTITEVNSRGYDTLEDAIASKALNVALSFDIEVTDASAYEIIANNDYYLAVSNSVFIAYTDDGIYWVEAFTCFTDCTKEFLNNEISGNGKDFSVDFPPLHSYQTSIPIAATSSIYVDISNWLKWCDNQAYITLKLGNLEKKVLIRQRSAIPKAGATLTYSPTGPGSYNGDESNYGMKYYCLSGFIEDPGTTDWISLASSGGATGSSITVDDGVIHIVIGANDTGANRTGIVYLTTISESYGLPIDSNNVKRIKLSITQSIED